jgi:Leucine-rich repeat (LRR) protein
LNIIETSKNSWKINLSGLNLTSKEVWNLFAEVDIKDSKNLEVDLSWNRISTIPNILFQKKWIKSLDLNRNFISEISTDIFRNFDKNKCNLEDLSLNWNNINQVPEELFININKLKSFSISSKKIIKIPESVWNLVNLQNLNISATWVESIPNSIVKCKNLKSFYADYCKLNNLPDWLWELTSLKSLDLSGNEFSTIPDLSKLNKLEHLNISWNENLKSIPEISYDELKTLRITWCDNTTPPIEEFKINLNRLYPNIQVYSEKYKNSRINTWEDIKQTYFSWWDRTESISWNPNNFFNDNEQYEQTWLIADSLNSWLSKAKEDLWIWGNTPIFYVERKRSDWTVSLHVFTKSKKKD